MRKRILAGVSFAASCIAGALFGQTPAPSAPPPEALAFEVASIKPAPPLEPAKLMSGKIRMGMQIDAARVTIGSLPLSILIQIAYKVKPHQVTGPDWMSSQRFDIEATIPEGVSKDKVSEMLQALLVERFKLAIHRDNKEQSVYALLVAKGGLKMKEAAPDPETPPPADDAAKSGRGGGMVFGSGDSQVRVKPSGDGKGATMTSGQFGEMKMSMQEGGMRMEFSRMTMAGLTDMLSRFADRPVVDLTELKGKYQVALDLSMDEMRSAARQAGVGAAMMGGPGLGGGGEAAGGGSPGDAASTPSGGSIFSSVKQLGLKMEPRKEQVETIVVDHLEKTPTEN